MATTGNKDALLPAYLINGEDQLKRQMVITRLKTRIGSSGDLAFNFDEFQGDSALGHDIVSACNTLPFASEVRLVQVNDADALRKPAAEALVAYLASANPTTVLALVCNKLPKNTRLYKAVAAFGSKAVIDCTAQKRYELVRTLRSIAVSHGITLTEGAAQSLIELVGENTIYLDSEIRKLALSHRGTDAVNEREVKSLVSRTAEVKPWEFVDAFASRNIEKALICLSRMDSSSPHALLAMCVSRLRELICARALYERGRAIDIPKVLKMPDWRVKNHVVWSRGFTRLELREAVVRARDTEQAMKSGTDPDEAFLEWALHVMAKRTG